ncbi:hypothetical protein [Sphingobium boeckii]|uniref:Uncharacterized protein n=1 Tax=Sphingobium boeckii TaxID=1082345 RepID=A0A7W9AFE1_9SPHN|nr:hypothetical protein [Sphingobium boeckii]MBB5684653.1 hypothetical protein [Sphingobium boeckii]
MTITLLLHGIPVAAKDQSKPPQLLSDLVSCRTISDAGQRLICFDQTSAKISDATESKDLVVLDREDIKNTKRSLFGFSLPKLPFFSGKDGDDEPEFSQIETTITQVQGAGHDKWAIRTPEGATWQTTEAMPFPPRAGQAVTIKAGALGGYFMKIANGKAIRAMRVN